LLPCQACAPRSVHWVSRKGKAAALVSRNVAIRVWPALLAAIIALAALIGACWEVAAQTPPAASPLVTADPAPNALLAVAPDRITLMLAEAIDPLQVNVRLLRTGGTEVALGPPQVDASDPTRIVVPLRELLGGGGYTVVWSARAAADGAILAGAYPFRTGITENPGAARLAGEWPAPWAPVLRWLVFLGTALAAGGFAWARLLAPRHGARTPGITVRIGAMTMGALVAVLATILALLLGQVLFLGGASPRPMDALRAMPLGWWLQLAALVVLVLFCLTALASGRGAASLPAPLDWAGVGAGLTALAALALISHAASPFDPVALTVEIAHQWSTALWGSGLLYLAAGWRALGSDVARFRTVRWIGGALGAVSVVTGLAAAWRLFPSLGDVVASRYGQVLTAKGALVLVVLVLGSLAMVIPRRSTALRASRSIGRQGLLATGAVFLASLLALMAAPGTAAPATLAGVALANVVPVDRAAFSVESATIHLLTQLAIPGSQTLVVRVTDDAGAPLAATPAPEVQVIWTPFSSSAPEHPIEPAELQPGPDGASFIGTATLAGDGWWQADVTVTPLGGIASRARFWLVLPDPHVTGRGPVPTTDPEAKVLYRRGLASLTALRSVRYTQRLADGGGALSRSQIAVIAAGGERPAKYTETIVDVAGDAIAQQTIVGDRRWILDGEAWASAAPIAFLSPAAWGELYADATGFQFGPREDAAGELSQVVTFWQPPRERPARAATWYAWWIGLASGEVRREAMISTLHYMVYDYRDFNAPFEITPPVTSGPAATPSQREATPVATPVSEP